MAARLELACVVLAFVALASLGQLLVYIAFARIGGIALVDGGLGLGPVLGRVRVLGVPVVVRLLPLNCFVRPWPLPPEAVAAPPAEPTAGRALASFPPAVRVVFALLPLLVWSFVALSVFRSAFLGLVAADARALVRGALSPFVDARATLTSAASVYSSRGLWGLAARLLVPFALGQLSALTNLAPLAEPARRDRFVSVTLLAMALPLLVVLAWIIAWIAWLWG